MGGFASRETRLLQEAPPSAPADAAAFLRREAQVFRLAPTPLTICACGRKESTEAA